MQKRWWTNQASMAMRQSSCKNTPQYLRSCYSPIGQNNTKDFSAQSGGSIGRVVWKWCGKSRFPRAFFALLVNLRCFVSLPDLFPLAPANRPRVSEDDVVRASHRYREVTRSNPVEVLTFSGFYTQLLNCVHNCDDQSLLDLKSAVQHMKYFIHITSHPFLTGSSELTNDQLPTSVAWKLSLFERLTDIARSRVQTP